MWGKLMGQKDEQIRSWLTDQGLAYSIKPETFVIDGDGPKPFVFSPSFRIENLHINDRIVIVEPVMSFAPQAGLRRVQAFRRRFKEKYYVVLIVKKRMLDKIPVDAYDKLLVLENLDNYRLTPKPPESE